MRRRLIAVVGAGAILLLGATPALAKFDIRRVVVDGPGVGAPIVFERDDAWTFLLGGAVGTRLPRIVTAPAALGPEYVVTVVQGSGQGRLRVRLYPFADDRPILRVGDHQTAISLLERSERERRTGWVEVSRTQLQMLWDRGFPEDASAVPQPKPSPASPPSPGVPTDGAGSTGDATTAVRASGRPLAAFLPLGVLGVAGAVAAASRLRRFRRTATPGG